MLTYLDRPYQLNQSISAAITSGQILPTNASGMEKYLWHLLKQESTTAILWATPDGGEVSVQAMR
ncbi:MAG: hypothetical protein ACFB16_25795 [Phormidesmis sp.]